MAAWAVWDCMGDFFALRTLSHHHSMCCMGPHHHSSKAAVSDCTVSIGCVSDLLPLLIVQTNHLFALGLPIDLPFLDILQLEELSNAKRVVNTHIIQEIPYSVAAEMLVTLAWEQKIVVNCIH